MIEQAVEEIAQGIRFLAGPEMSLQIKPDGSCVLVRGDVKSRPMTAAHLAIYIGRIKDALAFHRSEEALELAAEAQAP